MTDYAELSVTTNFSFLRGASHAEELVLTAKQLGHAAIGVADHNTLAGVVRAHIAAKEAGLRLLVGARLVPTEGPHLICYPTDRAAYGRLSRLLSDGKLRAEKGDCLITQEDILAHAEGQVFIVQPPDRLDAAFAETLERFAMQAPGSVYVAATHAYHGRNRERIARLADFCARRGVPIVATNDVLYHAPERRPLQDVLTCIRTHCIIEQAGFRLEANAEYRFPIITYLNGAFFVDAGNVWTSKVNPDLQDPDTSEVVGKFGSDFINEMGIGTGVGLRIDIQNFVIRFDLAAPLHDPSLPAGERWDFDITNPVFNFAIGYPF